MLNRPSSVNAVPQPVPKLFHAKAEERNGSALLSGHTVSQIASEAFDPTWDHGSLAAIPDSPAERGSALRISQNARQLASMAWAPQPDEGLSEPLRQAYRTSPAIPADTPRSPLPAHNYWLGAGMAASFCLGGPCGALALLGTQSLLKAVHKNITLTMHIPLALETGGAALVPLAGNIAIDTAKDIGSSIVGIAALAKEVLQGAFGHVQTLWNLPLNPWRR